MVAKQRVIGYNMGVDKRSPGGVGAPRSLATGRIDPVTNVSVPNAERLRLILKEATTRFNHELMDDEERQLLLDRIRRLRRRLEA
jgi:SpoVK/Ycf46/Vps4 family AAA+-type ATPase